MDGSSYTPEDIRRSKDAAIKDAAFWSVMVGTGESSVSAFALKLGAPGGVVGFISAFPQFFGSLLQLLSLPLLQRIKNRRWFVAGGVFLQAALWLPMAALAFIPLPPHVAVPLVLLLFTLYFATGMLTYPPWAAWMAELVEENERGRYFAQRNRIGILMLLISTILGGWVLTHAGIPLMEAFALLFVLAFVCRAISAWYLTRMSEAKSEGGTGARGTASGRTGGFASGAGIVDWGQYLTNPAFKEERRFALFTFALYAATYIAAPYFDVYMLNVLHLDYLTWALLSISGAVARFFALPYWGRVVDRFGNRAVLFATGMLVPLTPFLWLLTTDWTHLFLFQMVSGIAWSGLELAAFNFIISGRERSLRTAQSAAYTFAKGAGYLGGALIGWGLILIWPMAGVWGLATYLGIFAISGIVRYAVSLYFLPRFSVRAFEGGMSSGGFMWHVLAVQPGRDLTHNVMQLSQAGMHVAQAGENVARRAAKKGLDFTVYMLQRGPLMIRTKKNRL